VIAALKRGSIFDHGVMGLLLAGYSMPIFWWGLLPIMFFMVGWTLVSAHRPVFMTSRQSPVLC
jgi:dipeptide transport system permease protein